jgi:hypothetical protein
MVCFPQYSHLRVVTIGTVLDDTIDEFAERIREHYDLNDLGDLSSSTTVRAFFHLVPIQLNLCRTISPLWVGLYMTTTPWRSLQS